MREASTIANILVVEHEAGCPPAHLGRWLEEVGCTLEVCRPYAGDALPSDLGSYDALLVLGGSMGAHDDAAYPWLGEVKALIRLAAGRSLPTLGICLGHQLAAVALGGEAGRNPNGHHLGLVDIGWQRSAVADPVLGPVSSARRAAHWNLDLVTRLPAGAELLATTPEGDVQAARLAPTVWGVQWHPEIGLEIFADWARSEREECDRLGVDVAARTAAVAAADAELMAAWRPLAGALAGLIGVR